MFAMQLYAFDLAGEIIFSRNAQKKCNYTCMECGGLLRLREGEKRQLHFYHLTLSPTCRQHSKGENHLQVQLFLQKALPQGEATLEYRFSEVNRIADVVWLPKKVVFEVQCSPLSKEEMLKRMEDYGKCGYQVIWILHDKRYNQWRVSALEKALNGLPYYFTNIDSRGNGFIYDQWEHIEKGIRKGVLPPLRIDPASPYPGGFQGDLGSLEEDHPYRIGIKEREFEFQAKKKRINFREILQEGINRVFSYLLKPYCSDE